MDLRKVAGRGVFACLLLLLFFVATAFGQAQERIFTRVGFWDVPREKWGAFVELFERYEMPVLQRMFEQGVIVEWGFDANSIHSPDDYTHSSWFSAAGVAQLEKVLDAYDEAMKALGDEGAQAEREFASMVTKHRDVLIRSYHRGSKSARIDDGYFFGSFNRVKAGKGPEFRKAWEKYAKPVYETLLAEGKIVAWGLDAEYIHTEAPGGMWAWYILADIGLNEEIDAAFEGSWSGLDEVEREARSAMMRDLTVEGSHRDAMTRIIHFAVK